MLVFAAKSKIWAKVAKAKRFLDMAQESDKDDKE
jgi:hypothetical protein